jgi:hypothetical protein
VTSRCQLGVLGEKYGAIRSCGWEEDSTQCVCLEVSGGVCCPVSKLGQLHFSAALPSTRAQPLWFIWQPHKASDTTNETGDVCGILGSRGCIVYALAGGADTHPFEHLSSS